jgi:D-inositol-3-phosphate glycosyltransferase
MSVERDLVAATDRVLVTSGREKENLLRLYGAEPARTAVVPCGVDFDLFRPLDRAAARRRIGAGGEERIVLYVGRLAAEKGLDRLLRAVARLKHVADLRLIVVGGDGERDAAVRQMKEMSGACGIADRVAFRGRVEQKELPWYYSAADLLALPSSYESFGMVALEALACGTPVAATRVGAMEELLRDAPNGRLAQDLRPSALADAIEALLKDRPPMTETIRRSVAPYAWSRVAAEVLHVYKETLAAADDAVAGVAAHFHPKTEKPGCCGCGAFSPA